VAAECGASPVLRVRLTRAAAPLSPAKIAILLHKNANTVRRLLSKLVADGKVIKQEKTTFSRVSASNVKQREQRDQSDISISRDFYSQHRYAAVDFYRLQRSWPRSRSRLVRSRSCIRFWNI
jgi:hypothetical protein